MRIRPPSAAGGGRAQRGLPRVARAIGCVELGLDRVELVRGWVALDHRPDVGGHGATGGDPLVDVAGEHPRELRRRSAPRGRRGPRAGRRRRRTSARPARPPRRRAARTHTGRGRRRSAASSFVRTASSTSRGPASPAGTSSEAPQDGTALGGVAVAVQLLQRRARLVAEREQEQRPRGVVDRPGVEVRRVGVGVERAPARRFSATAGKSVWTASGSWRTRSSASSSHASPSALARPSSASRSSCSVIGPPPPSARPRAGTRIARGTTVSAAWPCLDSSTPTSPSVPDVVERAQRRRKVDLPLAEVEVVVHAACACPRCARSRAAHRRGRIESTTGSPTTRQWPMSRVSPSRGGSSERGHQPLVLVQALDEHPGLRLEREHDVALVRQRRRPSANPATSRAQATSSARARRRDARPERDRLGAQLRGDRDRAVVEVEPALAALVGEEASARASGAGRAGSARRSRSRPRARGRPVAAPAAPSAPRGRGANGSRW